MTGMSAIIYRCYGVSPGQFLPRLGPPTMPSTRVLGECCVCTRPVLLYQGRNEGFLRVGSETALVHWECAEAVRISKAEPVQTAAVTSPEQLDREHRYRADLRSFHARTLFSILREFEDVQASDPQSITADMHWKIAVIRDEYASRSLEPGS